MDCASSVVNPFSRIIVKISFPLVPKRSVIVRTGKLIYIWGLSRRWHAKVCATIPERSQTCWYQNATRSESQNGEHLTPIKPGKCLAAISTHDRKHRINWIIHSTSMTDAQSKNKNGEDKRPCKRRSRQDTATARRYNRYKISVNGKSNICPSELRSGFDKYSESLVQVWQNELEYPNILTDCSIR